MYGTYCMVSIAWYVFLVCIVFYFYVWYLLYISRYFLYCVYFIYSMYFILCVLGNVFEVRIDCIVCIVFYGMY